MLLGSNSPYRNQKKFTLPDHAGSTPNIPYSTNTASTSDSSANPSICSLDRTPEHRWAGQVGSDGVLNGDVRVLSDSSSGVNSPLSTQANSVISVDDKVVTCIHTIILCHLCT